MEIKRELVLNHLNTVHRFSKSSQSLHSERINHLFDYLA